VALDGGKKRQGTWPMVCPETAESRRKKRGEAKPVVLRKKRGEETYFG